MTPDQLARSGSEHGEQRALFAWIRWAEAYGFDAANDPESYNGATAWAAQLDFKVRMFEPVPELRWCHAIPNGGSRGDDAKSRAIQGGKLKAEGVIPGICDVHLPLPCMNVTTASHQFYAGLYVEMKRTGSASKSVGTTSTPQDEFIAYARSVGYAVSVCFDWRSAANQIEKYVRMVRECY